MKPAIIVLERLRNQQLFNSKFTKPFELLSWLGAIQGQDYPGAKWAIGLRLPGITDADVEKSIKDKIIVRTWLMRGTLHLVLAEDINWMLELLAPRIIKNNARRYKDLRLNDDTLKRSNQIIKDSLADGRELNRKELLDILQKNGVSPQGQRGYFILQRASLDGLICQCGVNHNTATFISMDEISKSNLKRDDAISELARRYFQSRGPATINDYMWWSGLLAADARAGLEAIKSDLNNVKIDKKEYWYFETETTGYEISPEAHLLPTYDEYLFSYRDRSASLDTINKNKIRPENHYRPTIAINGQIIGLWKRTFKQNRVMIEYNPFITLNNSENNALAEAEQRYIKYLNMPVKP
jgi:hypothetical protein